MCASCEKWVAERRDPFWRPRTFGKVKTMGQLLREGSYITQRWKLKYKP